MGILIGLKLKLGILNGLKKYFFLLLCLENLPSKFKGLGQLLVQVSWNFETVQVLVVLCFFIKRCLLLYHNNL